MCSQSSARRRMAALSAGFSAATPSIDGPNSKRVTIAVQLAISFVNISVSFRYAHLRLEQCSCAPILAGQSGIDDARQDRIEAGKQPLGKADVGLLSAVPDCHDDA